MSVDVELLRRLWQEANGYPGIDPARSLRHREFYETLDRLARAEAERERLREAAIAVVDAYPGDLFALRDRIDALRMAAKATR